MKYIIILLTFIMCSCDMDDILNNRAEYAIQSNEQAEFMIQSSETGLTGTGRPMVTIIIKNTGNIIGYNVSCDIQVKKGNMIIGGGWAYFGNGGDIAPGEQAVDDAVFWELMTLDNCKLSYQLSWLTR